MLRILITVCFLILAVTIIAFAFRPNVEAQVADLLLNLGTEIIGIALTVAIVEWLFEKRRDRDDARKMAWRGLHRLDHAVWVWQGGRREFQLDELLALLQAVGENDALPEFTQNLLMRLGSDAQDTLRYEPNVLGANSELRKGLEIAAPLAHIRDREELLPPKEVARYLYDAAVHLARALDLTIPSQRAGIIDEVRDPSPKKQEWRHFGKVL